MYKQLERYRTERGRIRIAKYSRCSSDEQKKNGYTVQDQLDLIEDFSKEYELIIAGEYIDEGISATLEINKRKALSKLIKDAKAGKFDIVVFKCIDRFFRNVGEYYECQKQLRQAGVTWISIEESDLDPEDDDAAFKINIYLTMAEYEAKKTSKRIRFNNKMRIKNKQVVTGSQNFLFPWIVVGEPRNRRLAKNEEKSEMLYDILDHFEKQQSKRATLVYANMKYGESFAMPAITNLLTDTLLYGEYKGVADFVDPYITKDRFDKIQEIIKRNVRYSERTERIFIFSGMVKCYCCGRTLTGASTINNGKYEVLSYRCNQYRIARSCLNKNSISEKKIESQLLANLDKYISDEIVKIESVNAKKTHITDNTKKIAQIKDEMERLNTMFRKGRIDEDEYDKEYSFLEKELKKYSDNQEEPQTVNIDFLKGILESDFRTIYGELNKENKMAFWRNLIKEFTIGEDRRIVPESIIFF